MKKGKAGMFWGGRFKDFAKHAGFADTFFPLPHKRNGSDASLGPGVMEGILAQHRFCAAIRLWSSEIAA